MTDLIYLAVTAAFFLLALAYIWSCGRLQKGGESDEL